MNPQVKEKWINALLSGEYQQGQRVLRSSDNKFCCLGVLCDLYAKEHNKEWEHNEYQPGYKFDSFSKRPPTSVVDWAWLDDNNPVVEVDDESTTLTFLNDEGSSFEEIAKVIQEQL